MGAMLMFYVKDRYIKDGLILAVKTTEGEVPIAEIVWNDLYNDVSIQTIGSRLQDYIVSYDDYVNFVKVVDDAYDLLRTAYHKSIEDVVYQD